MSSYSYDDPRWYDQPENTLPPRQGLDERYPFPDRIHNDGSFPQPSGQTGTGLAPMRAGTPPRSPSGNGTPRSTNGKFGQYTVIAALLLIAFTGGWFGHQAFTSSLFSSSDQSSYYANLFQQAWTIVDQNYVDRKAINYQQMSYAAIQAMLGVLKDKGHTYFLSPAQVKAQQQQLSGNATGVGMYLQQNPTTQQVIISATIPGAPAQTAGFKSGDIIIAVGKTNVVGKNPDEIRSLIEGPVNTSVLITVQRPSTKQTLTISVTRQVFKIPDVIMHYISEAHIAHIQVLGFDSGVSDQLKTALIQAKRLGATSIILDLRDNPGGYLQEAINTASLFLDKGKTVLLEQDSTGNRTTDSANGNPVDTHIPLVVLVNDHTASAAEIVSGALQDNHRATIMGTTTLGTGTVLNEFDLPDGSAIYLGVMEWLTPDGHFIRDKGITPNVTVTLPANNFALTPNQENQQNLSLQQILTNGDTQLISAIKYLQTH